MPDVWPATLPQDFLVGSFSESEPETSIQTEMDTGPRKSRQRFTAAEQPISGSMNLTAAQKATLRTFYRTTLGGGSLSFEWQRPGENLENFRFAEPPQYSALGADNYQVNLQLLILP